LQGVKRVGVSKFNRWHVSFYVRC